MTPTEQEHQLMEAKSPIKQQVNYGLYYLAEFISSYTAYQFVMLTINNIVEVIMMCHECNSTATSVNGEVLYTMIK